MKWSIDHIFLYNKDSRELVHYSHKGERKGKIETPEVLIQILPSEFCDVLVCLGEEGGVYLVDELRMVREERESDVSCVQLNWNGQSVYLCDFEGVFTMCE